MNILITNDDGYQAEGILFLKEYFEKKNYNVYVVAPDTEKSGFSHSVTFKDALRLVYQKDNLWVVRGTPADCVNLALLGMIDKKIDLIVSGINHGPNIGKDIIYSGTVGGARQGALQNIPSMAFSIDAWGEKLEFSQVEYFLDNYFDKLMDKDTTGFMYNVNFPNVPKEKICGIKKTKPCNNHYYQDKLVTFDSKTTGVYYWIKGEKPIFEKDEGTDAGAVKNNFISVCPIKILPEDFDIDIGI